MPIQRRWVVGKVYSVHGRAKRVRRLLLVGRANIDGKEVLLFRAQRTARKQR